jgi:putative Mn2+ efflux pump MntP
MVKIVDNPKRLIIIGAILVIFGFVAPFMMVLGYLQSTFVLNFLSYTASVVGVFLGMLGAALYVRTQRKG